MGIANFRESKVENSKAKMGAFAPGSFVLVLLLVVDLAGDFFRGRGRRRARDKPWIRGRKLR